MTQLDHRVHQAQRRLWLNRWLAAACWCIAGAAGLLALVILVARSFDLAARLDIVALGLAGAAGLASLIWLAATREDTRTAAARLDAAAGLRERISSGLYCRTESDEFAQAVVNDAERISGLVTVRQYIRLATPRGLGYALVAALVCGLTFLTPRGWALRPEEKLAEQQVVQAQQTALVVKNRLDSLVQAAQNNDALKDLDADLKKVAEPLSAKLERPADIRYESVQKLDNLANAVKEKRNAKDYENVTEMQRMLRGLNVPEDPMAASQKLTKALAQGDFKTAREEMQAMKETLATLKSEEDKEAAEKLIKQLDQLGKQIEQLAKNEQLQKKLEQAGVKKEDAERMVENLKKEDLEQLQKQLAEQGMNQQQVEQLAKQLQQNQGMQSAAKQLAQSMQQGGMAQGAGQVGEAMEGLSQASDQLSELEQLQQEMNQLDSMLADIDSAKNDLGNPCSSCGGTGQKGGQQCGSCQGAGSQPGSGMGKNLAQGRGGLAPIDQTNVGFKIEKGKVHTGQGAIIGQFLVEGEQVKGDVTKEAVEVITAAEYAASEAVNRDRVPRQYQKAVKEYFRNATRAVNPKAPAPAEEEPADEESEEKESAQPSDSAKDE